MRDFINVKLHIDDVYNLFADRVIYNLGDTPEADLYIKMYEEAIDEGVFDEQELRVNVIVDNDIHNYTQILYKKDLGEEFFNKLCGFYKEGKKEIDVNEDLKDLDLEDLERKGMGNWFYAESFYIEQINEDLEMILIRCYFN
ncbi:hypothetical protein [Campylobacter cuniculorum]|uniref:Uncharacterized protein n=2 Tax=Campylobacter cuniculorum TaxID=374106 RepID=A0A1W6BYI2_9BACT|nr:hypothetical protein [Campylobacter cuniculorum]ARJ57121.1 hypothetical protein CCUN_1538 [Campylobacter cuniculorum DSM 23162 = LMG 24588]ARJ57159.1 hypothetical protein CCUN_1576 [Campylobacter cuniculorum DSM 23162 = LMG 24588]QOR04566.1 hypothetical protein A0071_01035 [Campylobacter cuniculorum]QOR04601.1 hypothetical protein A0071_01215 [Campylobacter cuniculorum]